MKIINASTKVEALDAVQPHPRNPRQGDVGAIHQSIEANGFYGHIVAQRSSGHILAGNHRWIAAKQAGAKRIPVTWVDVDDDHALRILLADNRTNDLASYDDTSLAQLLVEIQEATGGLAGTGYDGDDLDDLLASLELPDLAAGAPEALTGDEGNVTIRLDVTPRTGLGWKAHREQHDTDDAALRELLE